MASCDKCFFMTHQYDTFRQNYDDVDAVDDKSKPHHYCPMYTDHIPEDIFYGDADCEFYEPVDSEEQKGR